MGAYVSTANGGWVNQRIPDDTTIEIYKKYNTLMIKAYRSPTHPEENARYKAHMSQQLSELEQRMKDDGSDPRDIFFVNRMLRAGMFRVDLMCVGRTEFGPNGALFGATDVGPRWTQEEWTLYQETWKALIDSFPVQAILAQEIDRALVLSKSSGIDQRKFYQIRMGDSLIVVPMLGLGLDTDDLTVRKAIEALREWDPEFYSQGVKGHEKEQH
ncbi:uncharacterized protein J4E84_006732 [Alternaria hordeiaustralica]|uniref:uncharacterized protein n=1 Tax=Alternaria hordeiaustralica TaxID=1187925 RepID=UPI0020C41240|nr:uncharacterized protein J4E84_006732 [Alternaria hordeiaustralica]KAI4683892.1 hypothetical protein J4E84_006732 [Alternaria hordeiaustralica]